MILPPRFIRCTKSFLLFTFCLRFSCNFHSFPLIWDIKAREFSNTERLVMFFHLLIIKWVSKVDIFISETFLDIVVGHLLRPPYHLMTSTLCRLNFVISPTNVHVYRKLIYCESRIQNGSCFWPRREKKKYFIKSVFMEQSIAYLYAVRAADSPNEMTLSGMRGLNG